MNGKHQHMSHEQLAALLTESMEAVEERLGARMTGIEQRQLHAVEGHTHRISLLEHSDLEKRSTLTRVEAKLDRVLAAVGELHDLKALMSVWARHAADDGK